MTRNKTYSFLSRLYDLIFLKALGYERAANFIVEQLPFDKKALIKVLDAGCGTGLYTTSILKSYPNAAVSSFDLNEKMIRQLHLKLKGKWHHRVVNTFSADLTQPLPTDNELFDLVITAGVLEHVNISLAVKNLSNHLKSGGYFVFAGVKNNFPGKIIGKVWGFKPYSKEHIINTFIKAGFTLLKTETITDQSGLFSTAKAFLIFKKSSSVFNDSKLN